MAIDPAIPKILKPIIIGSEQEPGSGVIWGKAKK
jgi:hypothetical protein